MTRWKRLLYYLLINIAVSACTVWVVLSLWERTHPPVIPTSVAIIPRDSTPTWLPAIPTDDPKFTNLEAYQVQIGDTLGSIALAYGVSTEDLMRVNQLSDPDEIGAGQIIFIPRPVESFSTPTLPPLNDDTPLPTVTPVLAGGTPLVEITTLIGAGDMDNEQVLIKNIGQTEVSLENWRLIDSDGNIYTFPNLVLHADGAVTVHTNAGLNTPVELFWGMESPIWEIGEIATLVDPQNNVRATYQIP